MKTVKCFVLVVLCACIFSCNKSGSSSTPTSAMSATVNGSSVVFSASFTNNSGLITMIGSNTSYTIQLYMKLSGGGGGTYTLGDPSTGFYATVSNSFATYSTSATYTGQAVVNMGSSGLYNGTFYFSSIETTPTAGGGTMSVSNGSFTNM